MVVVFVSFASWIVIVLIGLLSVAFFTLFERNVIGLIHSRVGPANVSFLGLLQPLVDAFKLLSNSSFLSLRSNSILYSFSPYFGLGISLMVWLSVPFIYSYLYVPYSILYFIVLGSTLVFCVLSAGWASNSKYSLVGSLRSVAQSVSYEAVITTLVICLLSFSLSYSVVSIGYVWGLLSLVLLPLWIFCVLAESHRAPFDFSEAESELVSGYNTEYAGMFFAFTFLSEYGVLLVSSNIVVFVFLQWFLNFIPFIALPPFVAILALVVSFIFIWIRVTYVRYRYDLLISAAWNSLLPISLMALIIVLVI